MIITRPKQAVFPPSRALGRRGRFSGHSLQLPIVQSITGPIPVKGERMEQKEQILSTIQQMVDAFHAGNIVGILKTYEPGAVVVAQPGTPVSGKTALEAMFGEFIAAGAHFTFHGHEVIQAGDLAIHLTPWRMTGAGPDGSPITGEGLSVAVLRRQPDGKWLMVIDNPYGDSILNPAKATQEVR